MQRRKNIVITKNVNHIGYNPFAGCRDLLLESKSSLFTAKDGIIYNNDLTQILCVTSKSAGKKFCAPDSAVYIGRSAFSGCEDLRQIQLNNVTYIDKSAFTNCRALEEIYIPDGVVYIGEWAFAYCINLKKVSRPMICGKCGHEWAPLITTGKCPNCGNQEGHKFKDQTANK